MGALIDKIKHKKLFIAFGYILWGLSTASFGLFNTGSSASVSKITSSAFVAAIMVVVLDGVMTYFDSTANDSVFNSYITSETSDVNRGKVEGVLAIMPLIAVLFITVVLNPFTTVDNNYRWDIFFYIVGGIVVLVGILAFILIPKEFNISSTSNQNVLKNVIYGFKPKVIKDNKVLYLVLICYFAFALSNQIFFPQLMIYIEETCKISNSGFSFITPFAAVFAISIVIGSVITVLLGFIGDKKGKHTLLVPTLVIYSIGLLLMALIPIMSSGVFKLIFGILSASIMMSGFISCPAMLNAYVREFMPKGKEGSFLGIRMIFVVLLPMVIGSNISEGISKLDNRVKIIDGESVIIPSPHIFVGSLVVAALLFFPLRYLAKVIKVGILDKVIIDPEKNLGYLYKVNEEIKIDYDAIPLNDYPRPQLRRKSFMSLKGCWRFDIKKERLFPAKLEQKIMVPYSVESKLSGIEKLVEIDDYLFYEKDVSIPKDFNKGRLILH